MAFTLADARRASLRKDQVYKGLTTSDFERIGRGTFIRADSPDRSLKSLAAATAAQSAATLCLTSALTHHGLSDAVPSEMDIALPRGTRHPAGFAHVAWRGYDQATSDIGHGLIDGHDGLYCYTPERSIVDAFRLAHREGSDTAVAVLKRWLRIRGNCPAKLLGLVEEFPKAYPAIRSTLEVLT